MKATVLDGAKAGDPAGERLRKAMLAQLQSKGWDVEHVNLEHQKIGPCAGDFFCWIRSPGICNVNDDNRKIAATLMTSDLMVYLTPITFGGYSSVLKRMVDHLIQNISPHFIKIGGETHHKKRYDSYPDMLVAGWTDKADPRAEDIFRHLVKRNAINFHAGKAACGLIHADQSDLETMASVKTMIDNLPDTQTLMATKLPETVNPQKSRSEVRKALLLVGSPKADKSTSYSLGKYFLQQLNKHSIQTETIYLHTAVRYPERIKALTEAVDAADVVTMTFPLYVDSLPAPVIQALEEISAHRQDGEDVCRPLFTAIINCGFPEHTHNATALAICETFARQAEFTWGGGLSLGAGQGLVAGRPLAEGGGRTLHIRKALELAATALAQGLVIPDGAQDLMSKSVIPAWAYRAMGGYGWKRAARPYGASKTLKQKPYAAKAT